ncbi:MAG: serine hydrolase domain-containing protein [Myxococcota bacterium]
MSEGETHGPTRRATATLGALVTLSLLGCPGEPTPHESPAPTSTRSAEREIRDCIAEHRAAPPFQPVITALCSERFRLDGVSVAVAIARGDEVLFETAVGPRCQGSPEALTTATTLRMGSVTKLVTAAVALTLAQQQEVSLREPLDLGSPPSTPPLSLSELLNHTSGLRDPEPPPSGQGWWSAASTAREAPGSHHYANLNYLAVGRWLERSTGGSFAELFAQRPEFAPLRERVTFDRTTATQLGCSHFGWGTWRRVPLATEAPLPAFTLPSGGGLASARDLARLPAALERMGVLESMLAESVPTERPDVRYGLGVRITETEAGPVLAHSGQTAGQWAELQWSRGDVAVAVMSSTPRAFKATLLAAFEAARSAEAE